MNRKAFLVSAAATAATMLTRPARSLAVQPAPAAGEEMPNWAFPDLTTLFREPIKIQSIELLRAQGRLLLVVKSADGRRGVTQCSDRMPHLVSLLRGLVLPHFAGQDARQLLQLVDNAYRLNSNYKYAGMPLWNSIGSVEVAVWDLLGQIAGKPVSAMLGRQVRRDYPVYVSDFDRERPPEAVADVLLKKMAVTGATGVKIKLGGRMRNTPEDDRRTRALVPIIRKRLGDATTIYADANGSYTVAEGIAIGRLCEEYGVAVMEEPCNFEDEDGIRRVNDALSRLTLAGGEQDTSLYRFRRLAQTGVYDVLQPDIYDNGGLARALQVAAIAQAAGKQIAPHSPKADPLIGPFWQFAAICPNLFGLQEFVYTDEPEPSWFTPKITVRDGRMTIPATPGMGIAYDDGIWARAEKVL